MSTVLGYQSSKSLKWIPIFVPSHKASVTLKQKKKIVLCYNLFTIILGIWTIKL